MVRASEPLFGPAQPRISTAPNVTRNRPKSLVTSIPFARDCIVLVRRETSQDIAAVRLIQAAAFRKPEPETLTEPIEVWLLDELRACTGWLPQYSLVVEQDNTVIAHGVCTRGQVGGIRALGLGPIGVQPDFQHQGAGSALMHALVGGADASGELFIALLGNPAYYSRFGFVASTDHGIESPDPGWGPFFQVRTLSAYQPTMTGQFSYAEPFQRL